MNERRGVKLIVAGALLLVVAIVALVLVRRTGDGGGTLTAAPSGSPSVRASTPTPSPQVTASPTPVESALAVANRKVTQNPLYRVGPLPASRCKEPAARAVSVAKLQAYYSEFVRCLDRAWAPVVRKAGYTFWAPRLEVIPHGKTRTQCALTDSAAYCAGVISMKADFDLTNQRTSDKLWTRTTMAFLVAHEYGHHIQRLTGISDASATRSSYLNGVDAGLAENRRLELQASCFSGVYLGADRKYFPASGAWLTRWNWTVANRGDEWNPERSHGNKANHSRWSRRGFAAGNPGACNTFSAAPATVA